LFGFDNIFLQYNGQLRHSKGFSTRVWCAFFFCTELPWNDQFSLSGLIDGHVRDALKVESRDVRPSRSRLQQSDVSTVSPLTD
jgi:hypothetical protein